MRLILLQSLGDPLALGCQADIIDLLGTLWIFLVYTLDEFDKATIEKVLGVVVLSLGRDGESKVSAEHVPTPRRSPGTDAEAGLVNQILTLHQASFPEQLEDLNLARMQLIAVRPHGGSGIDLLRFCLCDLGHVSLPCKHETSGWRPPPAQGNNTTLGANWQ
jgi:hypothetical protein